MLTVLFVILLIIVAARLYLYFVEAAYGPKTTEDEVHYVTASDGWRIALHRYRPRGENPHGEPVLLHHGLAASYKNFDLGVGTKEHPSPSLAHWLADRGYDVFVCDLRGRGLSDHAGLFTGKRWDWTVDDFIYKDDPAFVDYILERTGFANMHWIGLSMGGILLFCYCALHGSPKLASGVAAGSGLRYADTGSDYQPIIGLSWLGPIMRRVPIGTLSKLQAPLAGRWNLKSERFDYYPPNTAPQAGRAIMSGSLEDVSGNQVLQMSTLFKGRGLASWDGTVYFAEEAKNITTPTLLVCGVQDLQSSVDLSHKTRELFGEGDHKVAPFGKDFGHKEDYGHIDLVAGINAESETFPEMLAWLQTHPAHRNEE
ncbi:MAG: alpha/beta fold hydrolase [Candidatus Alcyoniella australis]|nr:alpha/beta fold hydrolase [Candidatus Alcyoniella australis]